MQSPSATTGKKAAALASWIVIQAVERNPDYLAVEGASEEFEYCLEKSFSYAEQEKYDEALKVVKNFLGKLSLQAPHILRDDPELFDAVGALAQLDQSSKSQEPPKLFGFLKKIW